MPIIDWLKEIDATLARSPGFFVGKPVVLDLSSLDLVRLGDLASGREPGKRKHPRARHRGLRGRPAELQPAAAAHRRAQLRGGQDRAAEKPEVKPPPSSLLLDSPVRSGQSVVFPEGDVTVLGSVGSGAEIVAGGSIHVYGTLRGRAMAGVNGNPAARIYCQRIEAELLAIDGYYQTAEEIDASPCATGRRRPGSTATS